eukprot:TRINITY_DN50334_c0_g1_i1.p1 TRINITY_DN50334_c0_g1~~TRINITY_DN50334_c0_g1_i1.p1  ORF type:complete len:722 (-),score=119.14 TRINITY_DN50334_c0_g1_i1:105-2270(-)
MGRSLKDPAMRRKGPAGTGRNRKREKRMRERSVKERQEQLTTLQKNRKQRLDHESHVSKPGGAQTTAASNQSTGFEKALAANSSVAAIDPVPFRRYFWQGAAPSPGEPDEALKLMRKGIGVKVRGSPAPAPVTSFSADGLPAAFKDFLGAQRKNKIQKPSPIQAQVWPAALCGLDVIGIAPTGSGKTLAYLLPALPHIAGQQEDLRGQNAAPVCVCLAPTRELAKQVSDVCGGSAGTGGWLKRVFRMRVGAVYGGIGKDEQVDGILTLGAPHILAATPGRLLDLMGLGAISLAGVTYLVLDEADRMLALGFEAQLNAIMGAIRPNRQSLLFSATFPGKLRESAEQWMAKERVIIRVAAMEVDAPNGAKREDASAPDQPTAVETSEPAMSEKQGSDSAAACEKGPVVDDATLEEAEMGSSSTLTVSPTVDQTVHVCAEHKKPRKLLRFIDKIRADEKTKGVRQRSAILIFCSQIKTLRTVAAMLEKNGEKSAALHSGIPQAKREQAVAHIKSGIINTLVATDVASRGLHISRLRHVVNYDFPSNLEIYCHRIGRVGRQGAKGFAYSFFTRNLSPLAGGLVAILERSKQRVDTNLRALVEHRDDASAGGDRKRDCTLNDEAGDEGKQSDEGVEEESSDADSGPESRRSNSPERIVGICGGLRIHPRRSQQQGVDDESSDSGTLGGLAVVKEDSCEAATTKELPRKASTGRHRRKKCPRRQHDV